MKTRFLTAIWPLLGLACVTACGDKPAGHEAAATVSHAEPESEIATVKLTAQAEARLGIKVARLERQIIARVRVLGGEVVIPPGRALLVTAPVAGLVAVPETNSLIA